MITTGLNPLGISWNVSIDNAPVALTDIQKVVIDYKENSHDVAFIEFIGINSSVIGSYIDKPVVISLLINGGAYQTFYGYIKNIEGNSTTYLGTVNFSPFQTLRATCFGASYIFRKKQNKVWNNVTLKDIVNDIAESNRFSYDVPDDQFVFTRLMQSNKTTWKFLVDIAKQLNYAVSCHGTNIHIWNPLKSLGRQTTYTLLEGFDKTKKTYKPSPGTIIKFIPVIGNSTTEDTRSEVSAHVLDSSGSLSTINSEDIEYSAGFGQTLDVQYTHELALNLPSVELAQKVAQAKKESRGFTYHATAEIVTDPNIVPGSIVKVQGYGLYFDGYWYVKAVRHELQSESLISIVSLIKDSNSYEVTSFPNVQKYTKTENTVLINNTWVAQTESFNVYN